MLKEIVNRINKENWKVFKFEIWNEKVEIRWNEYRWYSISRIQVANWTCTTKKEVLEALEEYFIDWINYNNL